MSHDDAEKKRADDIWSAFKADVAVPIKRFVSFVWIRALLLPANYGYARFQFLNLEFVLIPWIQF